jgi:cytochrome oxidase Cu insertion factor (SCO1/SenC/PrrC family)
MPAGSLGWWVDRPARDRNTLPRPPVTSITVSGQRTLPYTQLVLEEGTVAPDFTLPDQDGAPLALSDQRGKWVILWWFVEAATPG